MFVKLYKAKTIVLEKNEGSELEILGPDLSKFRGGTACRIRVDLLIMHHGRKMTMSGSRDATFISSESDTLYIFIPKVNEHLEYYTSIKFHEVSCLWCSGPFCIAREAREQSLSAERNFSIFFGIVYHSNFPHLRYLLSTT